MRTDGCLNLFVFFFEVFDSSPNSSTYCSARVLGGCFMSGIALLIFCFVSCPHHGNFFLKKKSNPSCWDRNPQINECFWPSCFLTLLYGPSQQDLNLALPTPWLLVSWLHHHTMAGGLPRSFGIKGPEVSNRTHVWHPESSSFNPWHLQLKALGWKEIGKTMAICQSKYQPRRSNTAGDNWRQQQYWNHSTETPIPPRSAATAFFSYLLARITVMVKKMVEERK